ncbi:molybdopterin molybdotransferase MoeA [Pusillimonas sp. CC-YST705]|uniref:Molybdopterin molybdenumtransferase n=1 Tax=Mesopusillimonas faecipullorum TaxID=2755040 RepID=A0ABS8CBT3_9BURK|nr:gephyrin-like molybdotransferase Glp [Mesopusillimonas faecipullorum]MCB5363501.1 molybdopterin molybdotransferase MoeA [Mesopusillimonas faecipullorum]
MLDFDTAQARMVEAGQATDKTENCLLHEALGRVLAETITATVNLPPDDNSAMDGYAVRLADFHPDQALPIQQRVYAGESPAALKPGHAIRLFTGSLIPAGADTVVIQENCTETDNTVTIHSTPQLGENVRKRGEDMAAGQVILQAGTRLEPAELTCLAAQGRDRISVYKRLRIGILTNGDELVVPGQALGPAQIYNTNGPTLAALSAGMGAQVVHQIHAPDQPQAIEKALATLRVDCDLILTVGGISVGEKDYVRPALEQAGASLDLWKVRMKPGKPVALAWLGETPVVCLPGNPVSAYVVFALMVTPLIRRMQGRSDCLPPVNTGRLNCNRPYKETRAEFLRVRAATDKQGTLLLQPYAKQGSNIISSLADSDGLARIPPDTLTGDGAMVSYYAWHDWLR